MSMYVFMVITETGIVLEAPSMNHNISHRNITASDKAVIILWICFSVCYVKVGGWPFTTDIYKMARSR